MSSYKAFYYIPPAPVQNPGFLLGSLPLGSMSADIVDTSPAVCGLQISGSLADTGAIRSPQSNTCGMTMYGGRRCSAGSSTPSLEDPFFQQYGYYDFQETLLDTLVVQQGT